jgi:hypothetical protein
MAEESEADAFVDEMNFLFDIMEYIGLENLKGKLYTELSLFNYAHEAGLTPDNIKGKLNV